MIVTQPLSFQYIYFLQYETPLFKIHVFRTRRLIHTQSLSWLQNLNFKFGDLRREKRRGLAFYTRTSCLNKVKYSPIIHFFDCCLGQLCCPSTLSKVELWTSFFRHTTRYLGGLKRTHIFVEKRKVIPVL